MTAILQDGARWLDFRGLRRVVAADRVEDVLPALAAVETEVERGGLHAAGFIAYEAARALGLETLPALPGLPLLWFGLYPPPREIPPPAYALSVPAAPWPEPWQPAPDAPAFEQGVRRILDHIAAGDTYQVNLTFPLVAPFETDPWDFFCGLRLLQGARHSAFVDTGEHVLCSASPELFFELDGDRLTTRPMKGTAPRGRTAEEDAVRAAALRSSAKDRAENLMIVDMLRNDLGRVARIGSVEAAALFEVEPYPTVLQMTSTVTARSSASLVEIVSALFPSASVTGAPKRRTMQIIAGLERAPRGVYTGAIGHVGPGRRARFNVAIRTVTVERARRRATFGVGSGIVADSLPPLELAECRLKASVLEAPPFALLETLRFDPGEGFALVERHLDRIAASARFFGIPCSRPRLRAELDRVAAGVAAPARVRLLLGLDGSVRCEWSPLCSADPAPLPVTLAAGPVDESSPWLYHKTTRREVYDRALRGRPGFRDVVLWNRRGEVTESCRANVVVETPEGRLTPPVSSGLLAGTLRAELLAAGAIREAVVRLDALREARRFFLINSVQGWREACWAPIDPGSGRPGPLASFKKED